VYISFKLAVNNGNDKQDKDGNDGNGDDFVRRHTARLVSTTVANTQMGIHLDSRINRS
jgi:hypothetical protein